VVAAILLWVSHNYIIFVLGVVVFMAVAVGLYHLIWGRHRKAGLESGVEGKDALADGIDDNVIPEGANTIIIDCVTRKSVFKKMDYTTDPIAPALMLDGNLYWLFSKPKNEEPKPYLLPTGMKYTPGDLWKADHDTISGELALTEVSIWDKMQIMGLVIIAIIAAIYTFCIITG
jgi:hypothetical protein